MQKTFCDRCLKEIPETPNRRIFFPPWIQNGVTLCTSCYDNLIKALNWWILHPNRDKVVENK
jgi:hypothetical protein